MERNQAREIIQMIEGVYPNFTKGNPEVVKMRIKIWGEQLMTWDYERTKKRLLEHIETSPYVPTIADVKPYEHKFDDIVTKINRVYEDDSDE